MGITRLNDENTQGINAVLERKTVNNVYPQIGHFFANLVVDEKEKKDEQDKDKLLVNVIHEGNSMIENLRILNLKPQICFRDNICEPINLYHKVGHGKLDMYVLNPSKDSREVREFLSRWHEDSGHLGKFRSGINVDGKEVWLPIANLVSICALLIWSPANPNDTMTRLLFPGSTPQHKIFKGLEKLKKLECLKYPTCSATTLQETKPRASRVKEMKKDIKGSLAEKSERQERIAKKKQEKLRRTKKEKERVEKERKEEKEKKEKEKDEKEKERGEKERAEKERKEKVRQEKIEKRLREEKDKKEKERKELLLKREKLEKKKENMASEAKSAEKVSKKKSLKDTQSRPRKITETPEL